MRELRGSLTGLGQPTYVLDIPGGHGKVPIGPSYLETTADGRQLVRDPRGRAHLYADPATDESDAGQIDEPASALGA